MRASGILMPVFSLPGPFGIGTLGKEAFAFVDFLADAKQTYWQILPIGPTGYGDSPYQSFSAFAGNPYFIDYRLLADVGLLTADEVPAARPVGPIDYGALYNERPVILKKAADRLLAAPSPSYEAFCEAQSFWLEDYALFMAVKAEQGQAGLADWPDDLRCRKPEAIAAAKQRLAGAVDYYKAVQFFFYTQWNALKAYANGKGVRLVGDIPIYVSPDSSDLWTRPELFQTDGQTHLTQVAGCPPDAFAADGQLWGNPLYDWPRHKAEDFAWWKRRMQHATSIYDVVRIDHFRAFHSYWSVPTGAKNAREGHWEDGPGMELLHALQKSAPQLELIAEDLGDLGPEALQFVRTCGIPGMKVMVFAFDPVGESAYLPHNCQRDSVIYTGTHDTPTFLQWLRETDPDSRLFASRYLRLRQDEGLGWGVISGAWAAPSRLAIAPLQDVLGLGSDARMNTPGTMGSQNWSWRVRQEAFNPYVSGKLREITRTYRR